MKSEAALFMLLGAPAMAVFPESCWNVTVIHSTATGWNDGCKGLDRKKDLLTEEACKTGCYKEMNCSVWQWVKASNDELQCWSGNVVHGCKSRDGDVSAFDENNLLGGERIMHGDVKVTGPATGVQVMGLKKYDENTGTDAERVARCKLACETDVTCTVWQYGENACWMEHSPGYEKKAETKNDTTFASVATGEYIEHLCTP